MENSWISNDPLRILRANKKQHTPHLISIVSLNSIMHFSENYLFGHRDIQKAIYYDCPTDVG